VDVVPDPDATLVAIDSGGPGFAAADGTVFLADTAFEGGSIQTSSHAVANTLDDALYNNWRWGGFAYRIAVANGSYDVQLHFAETYNSALGQRRFNASVQGVPRLSEFDIVAAAGVDAAHIETYQVDVDDGEVLIQFSNGSIGNARLDALLVRSAGALFRSGFESPP
jgi:hypothetical protein